MTVSARKARFAILAGFAASNLMTGCTSGSGGVPLPPAGLHYLANPVTYATGRAIPDNLPVVSGGPVASFSVSPALPAGLGLDAATGVISGTPTAVAATATYTVTASNAGGWTTAGIAITVAPTAQPPYGLAYSTNPAVYSSGKPIPPNLPTSSGGAPTAYIVAPALPAGLTLGPTSGIISGTPTTATDLATYRVTASNPAGSATVALSLTVTSTEQPPLGLTYSNDPVVYTVGTAIAANTPSSRGGAVTAYSVSPALPAGLSLNSSTGYVTGTPTAAAAQVTYGVTASNGAGATTAGLTLTVNATVRPPTSLVYGPNPATYTVETQITPNIPSSGGGAVTGYTVSPPLPAGLSLNPSTGVISGRPTVVVPTSTYVVTASNPGGSTTASVSITVNASAVAPTNLTYTPNPVTYAVGTAISPLQPPTYGGSEATFSVSPALPAGLSLNARGAVTGTPATASAQAPYVVTATNSAGPTTVTLQITVSASTLAPTDLQYPAAVVSYAMGQAVVPPQPPSHGGGKVASWSSSPALPTGLSLDPTSGAIVGTPTVLAAAANYVITAGNSAGSTTATLNITVTGGGPTNGTWQMATQQTQTGALPSSPFATLVAGTTIHSPLWVAWVNPVSYDDVTVTLNITGSAAQFYSYAPGNNTAANTSTTATCFVSYNSTSTAGMPGGCGLGLQPSGTPGQITIAGSVTASAQGQSYTVTPITLTFATPTAPKRTVTFANNSSQTLWVGITGGAGTSFISPTQPTSANPISKADPKPGGASQCGPSNPAAACPIGSTCIQGGANPNSDITKTIFYCYYDQGVPSPSHEVAPRGTTTLSISGASLSPSAVPGAHVHMIWSGNFYGRTGCSPPIPGPGPLTCENADCSGSAPGSACAPGTGPSPGVNTLAEVTFQTNDPGNDVGNDFYDVSIIGGANFAVQFGPTSTSPSTSTAYLCATAGNTVDQTYSGQLAIKGATWKMDVTSANFPSPGAPSGNDPDSYYWMVSVPNATTPTPCQTQATCATAGSSGPTCGFTLADVNTKAMDGVTRHCGQPVAWITANNVWAHSSAVPPSNPWNFTTTFTAWVGTTSTTVTRQVSDLQLCINNAYTSYAQNAISPQPLVPPYYAQDPNLACGGVIWGQQATLPVQNPATNVAMNFTNQTGPMNTPGLQWIPQVLPTLLWLKTACPSCYTFPFDDPTSTFQCNDNDGSLDYTVTFSDLQ